MNEYDVFLKLRSDRETAARAYRQHEFAQAAAETSGAKAGWLRVLFKAASQQIVKLIAHRTIPVEPACPTPPCAEAPLRAS